MALQTVHDQFLAGIIEILLYYVLKFASVDC